jgi:hypothetical protein
VLAGGGDEAAGGVVARGAHELGTLSLVEEGGAESEPGEGSGHTVSTDPSPGSSLLSEAASPTRRGLAVGVVSASI